MGILNARWIQKMEFKVFFEITFMPCILKKCRCIRCEALLYGWIKISSVIGPTVDPFLLIHNVFGWRNPGSRPVSCYRPVVCEAGLVRQITWCFSCGYVILFLFLLASVKESMNKLRRSVVSRAVTAIEMIIALWVRKASKLLRNVRSLPLLL